ncbi:MAG: hypothetical protein WDZ80_06745 [Candidatus Paceibacterota bacterium]
MKSEFESGVFGKEKDGSFENAVSQSSKGFGVEDFYPILEEKATTLLYLIVKKQGFVNSNLKNTVSEVVTKNRTFKLAFMVYPVYYYTITTQEWPDKR